MSTNPLRLMIFAGEISGDLHAAQLLRELRALHPRIEAFGIGGDALRAEGMELLVHCETMAVMGLSEVLGRYPEFRRIFHRMVGEVRTRRPDAVILVDYPDFNLRLAGAIRNEPCKKIYFICPQVWAWRRSRIQFMADTLDRLIAIFPFEPDVFKGTRLRVDYVGHPFVDETAQVLAAPPRELAWGRQAGLALLPGSRDQELRRMLPAMAAAARGVRAQRPETRVLLAAPNDAIAAQAKAMLAALGDRAPPVDMAIGQTREVLRQARAALITSGTATVEAALMECPMVIGYRMAPLTHLVGRLLVRVDHIGMVNIIAGQRLCPEFIQGAATPAALAEAVRPLLDDTPERARMREGLRGVREALGPGGAAQRAADIVLAELAGGS